MDELSAKINAIVDDIEAHPDEWYTPYKCRRCGSEWQHFENKEVVQQYREKYGNKPFLTVCEICEPERGEGEE